MKQVKEFFLDVGLVFSSSIVTLVIGFLLSIALARWLGAANLGLYRMVITVQEIALLVATFGISYAVLKYVAEYKEDKNKLAQTISSGFISSIIFGIVAGILLYILSKPLAGVFNMPELARLLKILSLVFPFASVLDAILGLFNGLRQMKKFAFLVILRSLAKILLVIAFIKLGLSIEGAVCGIALSEGIGCFFGLYLSRKLLSLNIQSFVLNAKKMISFGGRSFMQNMTGLIANHADVIMIGYFLAAKDVGFYSVAVTLSRFFLLVPRAVLKITYPITSEYWSKNNHQELNRVMDKSMKYCACLMLPFGLGVGFFSRDIITAIFGKEFIYAAMPLWVLLIGRIIHGSMEMPIGGSFNAVGKPEIGVILNVIFVTANIGLNILFIPRLGIVGAAIATTASLFLEMVVFFVLLVKILRMKVDFRWFSAAIGSACLTAALFLAGIRWVSSYLVGGFLLGVFIVLVFKLFLTEEDRGVMAFLIHSLILRRSS